MYDTPVNDGFTYDRAGMALKKAFEVERLLEQAESLLRDIEQDTHAELPDLQEAQAAATALTDDIKGAIEAYERRGYTEAAE